MSKNQLNKIFEDYIFLSSLVKENKNKSNLHKYWSRKPSAPLNYYIKKFSEKNEILFDPFCGSGSFALEAKLLVRNFLGLDLNPLAVKISQELTNFDFDINEALSIFSNLQNNIKSKILELYKIDKKCNNCNTFLYAYQVNNKGSGNKKIIAYCDVCKKKHSAMFDEDSLLVVSNFKIDRKHLPDIDFPKFYKDRFSYKGIKKVTDLYSDRNLKALSIIYPELLSIDLKYQRFFLLVMSNTVLHVSKLKGERIRPLGVNNYWIPNDYIQENVWFRFADRFNKAIKSKQKDLERVKNSKQLRCEIEKKSIFESNYVDFFDYIFADPPYGEAIQYSELSFVMNSWLKESYDNKDEIIINPLQGKNKFQYLDLLRKSFTLIYSSLKNEKFFTLTFQNADFQIWVKIVGILKEIGFKYEECTFLDLLGNTFNSNWSKNSTKYDIYLTLKKVKRIDTKTSSNLVQSEEVLKQIIELLKSKDVKISPQIVYSLYSSYSIYLMFKGYNLDKIITIKEIDTIN
jgi:DNA modification methylase